MNDRCCEGVRTAKFSRRYFIGRGGIALVGLSSMPAFLQRAVASNAKTGAAGTGKKQLVVLFQRGAADGLNIVVPFAEPNYYRLRPSIAIPAPKRGGEGTVLDLDGYFGLHPSLAPLLPLFQKNQLAIVHAAGSPDPTRSHFDAQDYMESGTPGLKATEDGWLDRALQTIPEESASPFRAVAMGPNLPRMMWGKTGGIAIPDLRQFKVQPQSAAMNNVVEGGFEAMYAQSVDQALHGTGAETFEAIDLLKKIDPAKFPPENGADYPKNQIGQKLQQIAVMIKANIGVEVMFLDCGGWDNHVNEGGAQGQLANLLRDLGQSLAAFHQDMGDRMADVVVVTMSEFGRTAKENGNRGTDHGHANCMFAMGGDIKGGRVYGKWPGLAEHQLNEGRDLALTTDFRSVVGEILTKHLGVVDLGAVFPGFENDARRFPGMVRA